VAKRKNGPSAPIAPSKAIVAKPIPNNVRKHRKELGLSKVELARLSHLSEKTIARIEKEQEAFAPTTYYKIRNGLNRARKNDDKAELSLRDVFPTLEDEE
jgi:predicted transcriptional regulator